MIIFTILRRNISFNNLHCTCLSNISASIRQSNRHKYVTTYLLNYYHKSDLPKYDIVTTSDMEEHSTPVAPIELDDSLFSIDKRPFTLVTEGQANVDFPSSLDVFYNPVQEFNRDISIAALRLFASDYKIIKEAKLLQKSEKKNKKATPPEFERIKIHEDDYKLVSTNVSLLPAGEKDEEGIRILEALAASGLRSIRYAKEIGGVKEIVANDISRAAVECMKCNLERNNVENIVIPSENDASLLMYESRNYTKRFTVIDIDPYGSPHSFLDGAVQCVVDGGLLLVTCTDMAVLCGNSPETCYVKYGALSMKHKACHEMALRIILQCIEANANKYGRYIVPLISMSADFYCRVFVKVFTSQVKCKESSSKLSWVNQCTTCESTTYQPLGHIIKNGNKVKYQLSTPVVGPTCSHCGGSHRTAGPIWSAPIHDQNFLSRLRKSLSEGKSLNTLRRIDGVLAVMEEELPDVPLYLVFDKVAKVLRMSTFKMKEFSSAILNCGYRVSPAHASKNGIKTDAPNSLIWEIMRAREKQHPIDKSKLPDNHPARILLKYVSENSSSTEQNNEATTDNESNPTTISFEPHADSEFESQKQKLLRFQVNPQRFWGPKTKSVTSIFHGDLQEKSKKRQGKRKRKGNNEKETDTTRKKKGEELKIEENVDTLVNIVKNGDH